MTGAASVSNTRAELVMRERRVLEVGVEVIVSGLPPALSGSRSRLIRPNPSGSGRGNPLRANGSKNVSRSSHSTCFGRVLAPNLMALVQTADRRRAWSPCAKLRVGRAKCGSRAPGCDLTVTTGWSAVVHSIRRSTCSVAAWLRHRVPWVEQWRSGRCEVAPRCG